MSSSIAKEFYINRDRLLQLDKKFIIDYLFYIGYYGETYLLPPIFNVSKYDFDKIKDTACKRKKAKKNSPNTINSYSYYELLNIEIRHTETSKRLFSLMHPYIYSEIVEVIIDNWEDIINHIYSDNLKIYSYSFPIPVTDDYEIFTKSKTMIYNFLTLEDKIAYDSYNYKYILRVDISKFYHSIYTHSITWALIGDRDKAFNDKTHFGNKLDSLLQDANHRQTNGIPIGPIISDIIAEIILARVDISVSNNKKIKQMDFVAIRFKDDYRFLFNTKEEAEYVLEVLEDELHKYNLWINKEKTNIEKMPLGLERKWKKEYNTFCNLSYDKRITIDDFQKVYFYLIEIEEKYPGTGMLSKFFDSLIDNNGDVIFKYFSKKNKIKAINLLSLLVDYSPRILPQLLSIIELIMDFDFEFIKDFINKMYLHIIGNEKIDKFRLVWLYFFAKKHNIILEKNEELKNKKLSQQEKELKKILESDPFIQYIDNNKKRIFDYEDDRLIIYKDTNYDDLIYNYISVFGKKINKKDN